MCIRDSLPSARLKASSESSEPANSHSSGHSKSESGPDVMKDLQYPTSPSVDKVIPPTPAKKVEFILRSSYLPSDSPTEEADPANAKTDKVKKHNNHSYNKGMVGLLSKWKKNHNLRSENHKAHSESPKNQEIENLIKLVFSITSLEHKQDQSEDAANALSSKFDILSARTIDEVEYFLAIENDLLSKIRNRGGLFNFERIHHENPQTQSPEAVSAMDNLNLYKTVSSIASSVISLSKTCLLYTSRCV